MKEAGQTMIAALGILSARWLDLLVGANQILLGVGSLIVVWFTVYNLYLRNKKLREDFKNHKK
ncbi:hypothetical protein [Maritalea myrionectae]|nr:hypothetical protein [Maritalea myrionectae]